MGEDLLVLQLRRGPHPMDRSGQQDDDAQQDQKALGNIGINNGIIAAEGNIQEHNDAKTNDRSTVRKPGGDIKRMPMAANWVTSSGTEKVMISSEAMRRAVRLSKRFPENPGQ